MALEDAAQNAVVWALNGMVITVVIVPTVATITRLIYSETINSSTNIKDKKVMKKQLKGLKTTTYEHHLDRQYLEALRKVEGFKKVVNAFMNYAYVKWESTALQGSNFHVTFDSCPELYKIHREATEVLDIAPIPPLYLQQHYDINAFTIGHERDAYIVANIGTIDKLDDDELTFILGHELGHVKSGHVLYHMMSAYLSQLLTDYTLLRPFGRSIEVALNHWYRMSEFSADRAGLLACQDLNKALSAMMKMTGLPERFYGSASVDGFIKQAKDFEVSTNGLVDKTIRDIILLKASHPWTVFRASELIKWYESGEYQKVIDSCKVKTCPGCGLDIEEDSPVCPYCGYKF